VNQPSQYGAVVRRGVRQVYSYSAVGEADFVIIEGTEVRAESWLRIACDVVLGKSVRGVAMCRILCRTGT